jgi:hypothetical protein
MVKKLKRQAAWAVSAFSVASPPVVRCSVATINGAHRGLDGRGRLMDLARILTYVTGTVDQKLLARNEYLAAENRILKAQLKGRLKLSDAERATLGEIGHRVGRKVLAEVAAVARPDTILAWYRKLVACKFDGSQIRHGPGRPRIKREVEQLIVRVAGENRDWGYDRIAGAVANLGYMISDQTVGNVLQRHALPPAPERKQAHDHVAGLHPNPPGAVGGDRLPYCGGADVANQAGNHAAPVLRVAGSESVEMELHWSLPPGRSTIVILTQAAILLGSCRAASS